MSLANVEPVYEKGEDALPVDTGQGNEHRYITRF